MAKEVIYRRMNVSLKSTAFSADGGSDMKNSLF